MENYWRRKKITIFKKSYVASLIKLLEKVRAICEFSFYYVIEAIYTVFYFIN